VSYGEESASFSWEECGCAEELPKDAEDCECGPDCPGYEPEEVAYCEKHG